MRSGEPPAQQRVQGNLTGDNGRVSQNVYFTYEAYQKVRTMLK